MLYADDEWLGISADGDDYGQGIDCGNDGGLDDVEYGGISGAGASNKNTMYNVDEDEDLDLDSAIEEARRIIILVMAKNVTTVKAGVVFLVWDAGADVERKIIRVKNKAAFEG